CIRTAIAPLQRCRAQTEPGHNMHSRRCTVRLHRKYFYCLRAHTPFVRFAFSRATGLAYLGSFPDKMDPGHYSRGISADPAHCTWTNEVRPSVTVRISHRHTQTNLGFPDCILRFADTLLRTLVDGSGSGFIVDHK